MWATTRRTAWSRMPCLREQTRKSDEGREPVVMARETLEKKLLIVALVVALVPGCGGSSGPTAPQAPSCLNLNGVWEIRIFSNCATWQDHGAVVGDSCRFIANGTAGITIEGFPSTAVVTRLSINSTGCITM